MVFGLNRDKFELKLPKPEPLVVLLLFMVGDLLVDQHTPLLVIGDPPSLDIVPLQIALLPVILETVVVFIRIGCIISPF